jgi:Tol biopolymer transport system component
VFDNGEDVFTMDADGTDLTRLTDAPGWDIDASWSPDGTRIAFRSERSGDSEIWIMNADGSDQQRLAQGLSPAWSPDGSKIAYASPGAIPCPPVPPGGGLECTGLSIMNADGSDQHRVPNADGGEYPTWSPDGKRIAFNSNFTGDHVMYVIDPDGSNIVDLSAVGEGWQVDWSPDGSSIIFASGRDQTADGYDDIYAMRPDGSDVRRLTDLQAYAPAWSPDGAHIVFSAPGLHVMNPDGTGVTALPTNFGMTALPDWTD